MSWLCDPELFMYYWNSKYYVRRNKQKFGSFLAGEDVTEYGNEELNIYKHLSSFYDENKGFFDTFFAYLKQNTKSINFQGLVVNWDFTTYPGTYFWSHERLNLPLYSSKDKEEELAARLAVCIYERDWEKAEKQALAKRVSDLEADISTLEDKVKKNKEHKSALVSDVQEQLNRVENDKQALDKEVFEMTLKLEEWCDTGGVSADAELWMSGFTVPSNWVPYEELNVLAFPSNTPLAITRSLDVPKFGEDYTTNVQENCFYRGMFPILVVNVAELTPDGEKARFDPNIWGLFDNGNTLYAARKPFESE